MSIERRLWMASPALNGSLSIERRGFLGRITVAGLVAGTSTLPAMAQQTSGQASSTVGSDQLSVGETLARYATGLRYEDLPEDVIRIAKRAILDTFGCAFGGFTAGPSNIAIKLANDVSARQGATVLFSGIRTSPDLAIFANGVMIRYLDFNDAFVSLTHGAGHPSDTMAALLTSSELTGRSGRDLITATVLAYEVFCKIADVFDYLGHGIDHSTITGIAAVVGASRLNGTDGNRDGARDRNHGRRQHRYAPGPRRYAVELEGFRRGGRLPQGDLLSAACTKRDDRPERSEENTSE